MRDMQTRDPRIDLRVPGGRVAKTGRDLLNDYLSMVTGGEATDEHLADICPTTHVSRQMPPTFVWGVRRQDGASRAGLSVCAAHGRKASLAGIRL